MEADHEACYRAISTRDARFDGRLFIAVRATRIYCRPICPARTPKRENVTFFTTASAAQEAGYRPCLRCRPESSPDLGAWRGTSNTVSRALTLIGEGALDGEAVDALAERLGVGERQLRRLFRQHLGASPIAFAQTRRVLFAKQLIIETTMPMAEVALTAGFNSIRRFNATFQTLYQRPPRELRRSQLADADQPGLRPADHTRARIESYQLLVEPEHRLHWLRDPHGNRVARVTFKAGQAVSELDVLVELAVEINAINRG